MIEDYPYVIHTTRELELMLGGSKPLAVFTVDNVKGQEHFTLELAQASQDFDRYVGAEILNADHMRIEETRERDNAVLVFDYYAYTLKGERWRAEAYFELMRMLKRRVWCKNLELLYGTLLGYTQQVNDFHISKTFD